MNICVQMSVLTRYWKAPVGLSLLALVVVFIVRIMTEVIMS